MGWIKDTNLRGNAFGPDGKVQERPPKQHSKESIDSSTESVPSRGESIPSRVDHIPRSPLHACDVGLEALTKGK